MGRRREWRVEQLLGADTPLVKIIELYYIYHKRHHTHRERKKRQARGTMSHIGQAVEKEAWIRPPAVY